MNKTEINWTELTWNPVSGCRKVSSGCRYCYAERLAEDKRGTRAFPNGFDITFRPHKLGEPSKVKRPSMIFVNSMSDFFLEDIPDDYRDQMLTEMRRAPWHRYQVLTKRPERAAEYFSTREVPSSIWLGTTVEHQDTASRIDVLRSVKATVRYVSAEPLLGPIQADLTGIHWFITGGESGRQLSDPAILDSRGLVRRGGKGERNYVAREDRLAWVRDIRDMCAAAGTAFWHKQWGGPSMKSGGEPLLDGQIVQNMPSFPGALPEDYRHRQLRVA